MYKLLITDDIKVKCPHFNIFGVSRQFGQEEVKLVKQNLCGELLILVNLMFQ